MDEEPWSGWVCRRCDCAIKHDADVIECECGGVYFKYRSYPAIARTELWEHTEHCIVFDRKVDEMFTELRNAFDEIHNKNREVGAIAVTVKGLCLLYHYMGEIPKNLWGIPVVNMPVPLDNIPAFAWVLEEAYV